VNQANRVSGRDFLHDIPLGPVAFVPVVERSSPPDYLVAPVMQQLGQNPHP